ncbi:Rab3 GTPase-activating protein regulatory subunit, partial [Armadillidium nasatum]
GKTSQQACDVSILKSYSSLPSEEIKTTTVKIQLINLILESKYLTQELVKALLEELSTKVARVEEEEMSGNSGIAKNTGDHEAKFLSNQLTRLSQLLNLYTFISSLHTNSTENPFDEETLKKKLCCCLHISRENLNEMLDDFDEDEKLNTVEGKKVVFEKEIFSFTHFLSCWSISSGSGEKTSQVNVVPVHLKEKLSEEKEISLGRFLFGWSYNSNHLKPFGECLCDSGLNGLELFQICILYWQSKEKMNALSTLKFFQLLLILAVFYQPFFDSHYLGLVKPLWATIQEKLRCWNKPLHAYVAALICRGIETNMLFFSHKIDFKALKTEEIPNPLPVINKLFLEIEEFSQGTNIALESNEWEGCTMDITEWNLLLALLNKLKAVEKFYKSLLSHEVARTSHLVDYSVKTLKLKGKGYLSELIAKWFIESSLPIETIINIIKTEEMEREEEEESGREMETQESLLEQLQNLRVHFAESTKFDILLVNLSWELAATWKKSPNELRPLKDCIVALDYLTDAFIMHGVSSMMWETWIVRYVQIAAQLMEKVSRRPIDRLCIKEIGISEFNLETFFSLSKELLEIILQGNTGCELGQPPLLEKDDFWIGVNSSSSLADVSVTQKITSRDLTHLHYQLLSVLILIVKYDMKNVKPYSLFPERDRASFFKPLFSSWKMTSEEGREVVNSSQLAFLTRVVSAIVMSLPDSNISAQTPTPAGLRDAVDLGKSWGVSVDAIRRHYVCELYSRGLDLMAEQALIMIRDGVMIGTQMINIGGKRLHHLLKSSQRSIELTALTTPNVNRWCKNLDIESLRCPDVPVHYTLTMVNKALILITENNPDYYIGSNLARTLRMICESGILPSD